MAGKTQKAGTSLTVGQYSQVVLNKYIKHEFSANLNHNLTAAADEIYVLLRKLRDAASKDSEDSKAPLKAIRNSIEKYAFNSAHGADSPEVEALLQLYAQLEETCQVAGDSWDSRPQLKLRVLKLMFRFMVRENERILAASRGGKDAPPIRLSRQSSFGKKALPPPPYSKWQDAINEMSRMQGSRMLPLLKLALLENLDLSTAAAAAATDAAGSSSGSPRHHLPAGTAFQSPGAGGAGGSDGSTRSTASTGWLQPVPAAPATPAGGNLREAPQPSAAAAAAAAAQQQAAAAPVNLDDLLGLNDAPLPQEEPPHHSPSPPSGPPEQLFAVFDRISPSAAGMGGSGSNPYAAAMPQPGGFYSHHQSYHLAGAGVPQQQQQQQALPPPPESVRSQFSAMSMSTATPGMQSPYMQSTGGGMQYNPSPPSYGSFPSPPQAGFSPPRQCSPGAAFSAPGGGGTGGGGMNFAPFASEGLDGSMQMYRQDSNPAQFDPAATTGVSGSPVDTSSPYFGKSNPFGDTRFSELAPQLQARRPPPPPPAPVPAPAPTGPPMRTLSNK